MIIILTQTIMFNNFCLCESKLSIDASHMRVNDLCGGLSWKMCCQHERKSWGCGKLGLREYNSPSLTDENHVMVINWENPQALEALK